MKLLLLNPNTSASMTDEILSAAAVVAPGPTNPHTYWPLSSALGLDL
jgi:Asp/Glu/hydantoin racemase